MTLPEPLRRRLIAANATDHTLGDMSSYCSNFAAKSGSVVVTTTGTPPLDIHAVSPGPPVSISVSGVHVGAVDCSSLSSKSSTLSVSTTSAS